MQSTMEFKDTIPSSRFYGVVGEVRHWYMNSGLTKWSPHEEWQVLRWVFRGFKENVISLGLKWSRKAAWQNCLALKAALAFIGGLEFGWAEWRECHMQSRCEKLRSTEGDDGSRGHEELWVRTPEWKGLFLSRSPFFSLFLPSLPSFPPQMIFFSLSCLILPLLLDPFSLHVLAFSFPLFHLFSSPFTLSHVEWDNITKYCIYWIKMLYPNVFNIEIKCVKAVTCFSRQKKTDDTKLLFYFNMTLCALFFGMVTLNGKHSLPNSTSFGLGVKIVKISVSAVTWRNDFALLILLYFFLTVALCPCCKIQLPTGYCTRPTPAPSSWFWAVHWGRGWITLTSSAFSLMRLPRASAWMGLGSCLLQRAQGANTLEALALTLAASKQWTQKPEEPFVCR